MRNEYADRLLADIAASPCSVFAVRRAAEKLDAAGFTPLLESQAWKLRPGGRYYTTRGGTSLIAFTLPEGVFPGFMISASHSDSPAFKLKEQPQCTGAAYVRLNTEKYGGMLHSSWMDRPLGIAGRLLVRRSDGAVVQQLVDLGGSAAVIPNVAIHMNRAANDGVKLQPHVDLLPIFAPGGTDASILAQAAQAAGVDADTVLGHDLYLYNPQPGVYLGAQDAWIGAPRLDDLACAFGCLEGFLTAQTGDSACVYCLFDNEEVGSTTRQGAASTLLRDVLVRICHALELDAEAYRQAIANSFLVSADNAHALHPNHPEYADGENCPVMNGGVVVKFNANQHYTTDGLSAALFSDVCRAAEVPVQRFANRADLPGGSTLGNIATTQVALHSVDIGLAQLAMHSSFETAGADDPAYLVRALRAFYSRALRQGSDGAYWI